MRGAISATVTGCTPCIDASIGTMTVARASSVAIVLPIWMWSASLIGSGRSGMRRPSSPMTVLSAAPRIGPTALPRSTKRRTCRLTWSLTDTAPRKSGTPFAAGDSSDEWIVTPE